MRKLALVTFTVVFALASMAWAHSGVKNAAVKARMDAMSAIGAQTKIIGEMAKGNTVFDADRARAAALEIARHAAETPALFEEAADDPKSEAKPEIWADFGDFTIKAENMERIARGFSKTIADGDDLPSVMKALAASCKDCPGTYRE